MVGVELHRHVGELSGGEIARHRTRQFTLVEVDHGSRHFQRQAFVHHIDEEEREEQGHHYDAHHIDAAAEE